ncbi:MAG: hypothetical protein BMS9Abin30_0361 [Gammaproteobacteria bacterium]|nr:MAG: hypothetical protein BMS9Abin30_0361 [Gammaproteobacteria bacterium]
MSFFDELKRRNVFRVGIAYAISAWVLMQIVDLVLENITAPGWIMQVFMLALAIGFPVALIFAWAFEMTSDGVKLERDVDRSESITQRTGQKLNRNITIVLGVAVIFLLADRFLPDADTKPQPAETTKENTEEIAATKSSEKSIAVLPFVDMSPEGDQAYFADGISEEILNVLVKTHNLKVAGRTSSFQFRNRSEDLKTIGEQLGVDHILEGSIRKANNRVRITAQLVAASDGFHLWSETYDRDLTDIFAIQDEIARAIASALAIELNLPGRQQSLVTASTSNMEAYDRYLEGKGLIAQRLDFTRSIRLLEEAIQLDPDFAAGWAAGAQAYSLSGYYLPVDRSEMLERAEAMANKALELDPKLSTAYSVLGDVYRDRYQWTKSRKSYLRALELNPNDVEANSQYAQMLWRVSYVKEGLKYSARAVELDPLSWLNLTVSAALRFASGDRAGGWSDIERARNISNLVRNFPARHAVRMALSDGNLKQAVKFTQDLSDSDYVMLRNPDLKTHYDDLLSRLNSRTETLAFLQDSQRNALYQGVDSPWAIDVFWAAYYGDYALAEKIMDAGAANDLRYGLIDTTWLNYAVLNPLHNTEPYKNMIRNIKLDDFWRENGFPEYCRPLGEDDFACN